MAKRKPVKFTAIERRVFEIPQREPQIGPEAEALRKMIDAMPFLIEVAEHRFDPFVSQLILRKAGLKAKIELETDWAINEYQNKRSAKSENQPKENS